MCLPATKLLIVHGNWTGFYMVRKCNLHSVSKKCKKLRSVWIDFFSGGGGGREGCECDFAESLAEKKLSESSSCKGSSFCSVHLFSIDQCGTLT